MHFFDVSEVHIIGRFLRPKRDTANRFFSSFGSQHIFDVARFKLLDLHHRGKVLTILRAFPQLNYAHFAIVFDHIIDLIGVAFGP